MIKILFVIHDLGQGGAEKVLVNLVNNMDHTKFDITVLSIFGGGVNEQFLSSKVRYKTVFSKMIPGNSKLMKLLSPEQLHKRFIKEKYDIEISYLEGPSARIVSGCPNKETKLISWIHVEQHTMKKASSSFRNKEEATECYNRFNEIVAVSKTVADDFQSIFHLNKEIKVIYNTVLSEEIRRLGKEQVIFPNEFEGEVKIIGVGSLKKSKGFDRLIRIHKRLLSDGFKVHTYILGKGELKEELMKQATELGVANTVTLLGYQLNPYAYVEKCDLFVCCSFAEGFSTAATEALIVGTPVCTVEVSGMKEMLGENNEYGIVTDNTEEALYTAIKKLLSNKAQIEHYKQQALLRGNVFSTVETVKTVENFIGLVRNG